MLSLSESDAEVEISLQIGFLGDIRDEVDREED